MDDRRTGGREDLGTAGSCSEREREKPYNPNSDILQLISLPMAMPMPFQITRWKKAKLEMQSASGPRELRVDKRHSVRFLLALQVLCGQVVYHLLFLTPDYISGSPLVLAPTSPNYYYDGDDDDDDDDDEYHSIAVYQQLRSSTCMHLRLPQLFLPVLVPVPIERRPTSVQGF
jgi:hypothetical protein